MSLLGAASIHLAITAGEKASAVCPHTHTSPYEMGGKTACDAKGKKEVRHIQTRCLSPWRCLRLNFDARRIVAVSPPPGANIGRQNSPPMPPVFRSPLFQLETSLATAWASNIWHFRRSPQQKSGGAGPHLYCSGGERRKSECTV